MADEDEALPAKRAKRGRTEGLSYARQDDENHHRPQGTRKPAESMEPHQTDDATTIHKPPAAQDASQPAKQRRRGKRAGRRHRRRRRKKKQDPHQLLPNRPAAVRVEYEDDFGRQRHRIVYLYGGQPRGNTARTIHKHRPIYPGFAPGQMHVLPTYSTKCTDVITDKRVVTQNNLRVASYEQTIPPSRAAASAMATNTPHAADTPQQAPGTDAQVSSSISSRGRSGGSSGRRPGLSGAGAGAGAVDGDGACAEMDMSRRGTSGGERSETAQRPDVSVTTDASRREEVVEMLGDGRDRRFREDTGTSAGAPAGMRGRAMSDVDEREISARFSSYFGKDVVVEGSTGTGPHRLHQSFHQHRRGQLRVQASSTRAEDAGDTAPSKGLLSMQSGQAHGEGLLGRAAKGTIYPRSKSSGGGGGGGAAAAAAVHTGDEPEGGEPESLGMAVGTGGYEHGQDRGEEAGEGEDEDDEREDEDTNERRTRRRRKKERQGRRQRRRRRERRAPTPPVVRVSTFDDTRLAVFPPEWFRDKVVLDVGCNTGYTTLELAERLEPRCVRGIDRDPILIARCRRHLQERASQCGGQFPRGLVQTHGPLTTCPRDATRTCVRPTTETEAVKSKLLEFFRDIGDVTAATGAEVSSPKAFPENVAFEQLNVAEDFPVSERDEDESEDALYQMDSAAAPHEYHHEDADADDDGSGGHGGGGSEYEGQSRTRRRRKAMLQPTFDVILCFDVTKFVHLCYGDAGLRRMFKALVQLLKPGGRLIIQFQQWAAYQRDREKLPLYWHNATRISLRPAAFPKALMNMGLLLEAQHSVLEGAQCHRRALFVFYKP